jgi:hypothetical protein
MPALLSDVTLEDVAAGVGYALFAAILIVWWAVMS